MEEPKDEEKKKMKISRANLGECKPRQSNARRIEIEKFCNWPTSKLEQNIRLKATQTPQCNKFVSQYKKLGKLKT